MSRNFLPVYQLLLFERQVLYLSLVVVDRGQEAVWGRHPWGTLEVPLAGSLQCRFLKLPQGSCLDPTQQGEVRCGSLTLYTVPSESSGLCPWSSGLCLLNPQKLPGCLSSVSTWSFPEHFKHTHLACTLYGLSLCFKWQEAPV